MRCCAGSKGGAGGEEEAKQGRARVREQGLSQRGGVHRVVGRYGGGGGSGAFQVLQQVLAEGLGVAAARCSSSSGITSPLLRFRLWPKLLRMLLLLLLLQHHTPSWGQQETAPGSERSRCCRGREARRKTLQPHCGPSGGGVGSGCGGSESAPDPLWPPPRHPTSLYPTAAPPLQLPCTRPPFLLPGVPRPHCLLLLLLLQQVLLVAAAAVTAPDALRDAPGGGPARRRGRQLPFLLTAPFLLLAAGGLQDQRPLFTRNQFPLATQLLPHHLKVDSAAGGPRDGGGRGDGHVVRPLMEGGVGGQRGAMPAL